MNRVKGLSGPALATKHRDPCLRQHVLDERGRRLDGSVAVARGLRQRLWLFGFLAAVWLRVVAPLACRIGAFILGRVVDVGPVFHGDSPSMRTSMPRS